MKKFIVISLMLIVGLSIFSACKEEDYPDEIRVSNFPPYPPAPSFPAPALVTFLYTDNEDSTKSKITWTAVPNAVSYTLYFKDQYDVIYKSIPVTNFSYDNNYSTNKKIYTKIEKSLIDYIPETLATIAGVSATSINGINSSITWRTLAN